MFGVVVSVGKTKKLYMSLDSLQKTHSQGLQPRMLAKGCLASPDMRAISAEIRQQSSSLRCDSVAR